MDYEEVTKLTLTRYSGQSIEIGTDIVVTVDSTSDQEAEITIQAPRHIAIWREEVANKMRAEGRQPATITTRRKQGPGRKKTLHLRTRLKNGKTG